MPPKRGRPGLRTRGESARTENLANNVDAANNTTNNVDATINNINNVDSASNAASDNTSNISRPSGSSTQSGPSNQVANNQVRNNQVGNSQVPLISIKDISSLIPSFNGENIPVNNFIDLCKQAIAMTPPSYNIYFTQLIKSRISGKASRYISNQSTLTIDSIFANLKQAFGSCQTLSQWQGLLATVHQEPNEKIIDYVARINVLLQGMTELIQEKYPINVSVGLLATTQEGARDSFIRGLRGELSALVSSEKPIDFDAAVKIATEKQKELEQRNDIFKHEKNAITNNSQNNEISNNSQNYHNRHFTHNSQNQHDRPFHRNQGPYNPQNRFRKHIPARVNTMQSNYLGNSFREQRTCYACGKPGHLMHNCNSKFQPGYCVNCRMTGHSTRNCSRNNSGNINGHNSQTIRQNPPQQASININQAEQTTLPCVAITSDDLRNMKN